MPLIRTFLLTAGVLIGGYLAATHWLSFGVVCPGATDVSWINCNFTINSPGSTLLGIPLGFWGSLWCLGSYGMSKFPGKILWILGGMAGTGWAIGHELYWESWCVWCTVLQLIIMTTSLMTWAQPKFSIGGPVPSRHEFLRK